MVAAGAAVSRKEIASALIMPCRKVIPAVTRSRILAVIAALVLGAAGGSVAYIVIPGRPPAPEIQRPVMVAWSGG